MRSSDWSSDVCSSDLHLASKVHIALLDCDTRRGFIFAHLRAEALDFGFEDSAPGDQPGKIVARLALRGIGVANLLIEDAQRIGVDDCGGRLMRACTAEGEQFTPDGHRNVRSEEHTSELQSLMRISYAVFCLQKKKDK